LPVCYWLERDYPSYLLVRWFDEAINDFLISNTNHSLKNIAIVLDSEKEEFLKYLQVEKSMMLSRSLSLCNEYKLDDLDLNSNEFKFICKHFGLTMRANEFFINKVQRVSNPFLKHMYSSIKESTRINNPKNTQLEYKLFHGTDMNTIIKICKSGFNRSFCGKNGVVFGCGVYFARDARYSHTYSAKSHSSYPFSFVSAKTYNTSGSNNYCMILSRVIVGMYERGSSNMKDTNLRKDNSQHQYDSTVDNEHNPTIFVIYKDFQALPEYLIHYSKS
jgi:poly [ADP-ribose] polymerase 10/14/15